MHKYCKHIDNNKECIFCVAENDLKLVAQRLKRFFRKMEKAKAILLGGQIDGLKVEVNKLKPAPLISIPKSNTYHIYKKSSLIDRRDGITFMVYEFSHTSPERPKVLNSSIVWDR